MCVKQANPLRRRCICSQTVTQHSGGRPGASAPAALPHFSWARAYRRRAACGAHCCRAHRSEVQKACAFSPKPQRQGGAPRGGPSSEVTFQRSSSSGDATGAATAGWRLCNQMKFSCNKDAAVWITSDWSKPLLFKPTCTRKALTCFDGTRAAGDVQGQRDAPGLSGARPGESPQSDQCQEPLVVTRSALAP